MGPRTRSSNPQFGSCLVVGGCGFLGYHLVEQLLRCGDYDNVYVFDRNVRVNLREDATYIQGEITDANALRQLLDKIQPSVVFHAASPIASLPGSRLGEYTTTNVEGTKIIIALATESASVKALVYTSTVDVYANPPHVNVTEDHPLWPASNKSNEYNRTKAIGDQLVRAANCAQLRTVCLRLGHAYGDRQSQGLVEILNACEGTKPLIQVGDGSNLMEVMSAANCATGHVLAAKALLKESDSAIGETRVGGEAFNISDGAPVPFWHHVRVIWGVARGSEALERVTILPAWIMVAVVVTVEWALWLFTLNTVKPPTELSRTSLEYCIYPHTYSIDKAKKLLEFRPVADHDAVLARAAKLMLEQRAESRKVD